MNQVQNWTQQSIEYLGITEREWRAFTALLGEDGRSDADLDDDLRSLSFSVTTTTLTQSSLSSAQFSNPNPALGGNIRQPSKTGYNS